MDEETKKEFEEIWKEINEIKKKISKEQISSNQENSLGEGLESKIQILCNEIGIARKEFDLICYLKDREIFLLKPINGKMESEKQVKTSLVLLTLRDYLFDDDFVNSSEISRVLKKLGIKSIPNLSKNLGQFKQFFIPEGKKASKNFGFRVTVPGKIEGKKIINSFLREDGN